MQVGYHYKYSRMGVSLPKRRFKMNQEEVCLFQSVLDPLLQTSCQRTFLKVLYFQEGRGGWEGKGREKDMIRLKHYAHMQLPNTFLCTLKPFHHFLHLLKENSFSFLGVSSFVPLDDGIFT